MPEFYRDARFMVIADTREQADLALDEVLRTQFMPTRDIAYHGPTPKHIPDVYQAPSYDPSSAGRKGDTW